MSAPDALGRLWQNYTNGTGMTVPAFGVLKVTERANGILTIARPNGAGALFAINNEFEVVDTVSGQATSDSPTFALYDDADGVPANGETWGPGTDTFKLRKGLAGFKVIGQVDATNKNVFVERETYRSPLTTKGDIIVHNGAAAVRFAVGANGSYLTTASAEAAGVKWVSCGLIVGTTPVIGSGSGALLFNNNGTLGAAADITIGASGQLIIGTTTEPPSADMLPMQTTFWVS